MCGTYGAGACINGKAIHIGGKLVGLNKTYDVFEELYNSGGRDDVSTIIFPLEWRTSTRKQFLKSIEFFVKKKEAKKNGRWKKKQRRRFEDDNFQEF